MRLQDAWPLYHPTDEYFSMTSTHTFYPIKNRYNLASLVKEYWPWAEVIHLNNDLRYIERFRQLNRRGRLLSSITTARCSEPHCSTTWMHSSCTELQLSPVLWIFMPSHQIRQHGSPRPTSITSSSHTESR